MSTLFAFLHHIAAFMLFAALVVEFVLIKDEITLRTAQRLLRIAGLNSIQKQCC